MSDTSIVSTVADFVDGIRKALVATVAIFLIGWLVLVVVAHARRDAIVLRPIVVPEALATAFVPKIVLRGRRMIDQRHHQDSRRQ